MATIKSKIDAERHMRELIARHDLAPPDHVEYGDACIRLFWFAPRLVVVIDLDEAAETTAGGP